MNARLSAAVDKYRGLVYCQVRVYEKTFQGWSVRETCRNLLLANQTNGICHYGGDWGKGNSLLFFA